MRTFFNRIKKPDGLAEWAKLNSTEGPKTKHQDVQIFGTKLTTCIHEFTDMQQSKQK